MARMDKDYRDWTTPNISSDNYARIKDSVRLMRAADAIRPRHEWSKHVYPTCIHCSAQFYRAIENYPCDAWSAKSHD